MDILKREALKALAFYDIFEYPLTALEIYKNLEIGAKPEDLLRALEELKNENKLMEEDGFFYLPEKGGLADERNARFLISFRKLQKAKRLAKFFSYFPFVRFAGACNSLGYFNAREESDIDFFIIAKRGRVWTTRFLTTIFLKIFHLRPAGHDTRDKFCLSFYVAGGALDISSAALPGGDPYFYRWFSWVMPLYDDGAWQEFITANSWVKNYLPNFSAQDAVKITGRPFIKKVKEKLFLLPEKFFRWGELRAMPKKLREAAVRGDKSVVISDTMLKFHLSDRRAEYRDRFYQKIKSINF